MEELECLQHVLLHELDKFTVIYIYKNVFYVRIVEEVALCKSHEGNLYSARYILDLHITIFQISKSYELLCKESFIFLLAYGAARTVLEEIIGFAKTCLICTLALRTLLAATH